MVSSGRVESACQRAPMVYTVTLSQCNVSRAALISITHLPKIKAISVLETVPYSRTRMQTVIIIFVWITVHWLTSMLSMLLAFVQVCALKICICRIPRRNAKPDVILAMLRTVRDSVLVDVLGIHKLLHILRIKYACIRVRVWVCMLTMPPISVLTTTTAHEPITLILIPYQVIAWYSVHRVYTRRTQHSRAQVTV